MTIKEVRDFLYNPDNIQNCENCPYNEDISSNNTDNPCGQYHCWVEVHVTHNKEVKKHEI